MNEYLLGIDLGTSGVKCVLYSPETGNCYCSKSHYSTETPCPGWTQQDPQDWLIAIEQAMKTLFEQSGIAPESIRGIGVCGAAHIGVCLDQKGMPCTPSLLWNDCRTLLEVEEIQARCGEWITDETLNDPGTAWTLPHLLWLGKHKTGEIARTEMFLTSKDYIVRYLTGKNCMDYSSATATLMYNPRTKSWCDEAIAISPLHRNVFPDVVPSEQIVGTTTAQASTRFGLPQNIPVIAGTLDSIAEFHAIAGSRHDCELVRLGSAGGIMLLDTRIAPIHGMLVYPYPGGELYLKQAATTSCGQSIDWIRKMFRTDSGPMPSETLEQYAESVAPGSDGLFFHPYLQGERAPYGRPDLRGSFIGLSLSHCPEHMIRAVLEGTAYSLRDGRRILTTANQSVQEVKVIGGGTGSPLWLTVLAAVFNRPLNIVRGADSSLGIAMLTADALNLPCRENTKEERLIPDPDLVPIYEKGFNEYLRIARLLLEL